MFVLQKPHHFGDDGLAMFFVNKANVVMQMGDLVFESMDIGQRHSQFDLSLMMAESKDDLVASFHFNTRLFKRESIESLASHFDSLLQSVLTNPVRRRKRKKKACPIS